MEEMQRIREKLHIRWIAYVIMPEHVHLLVYPIPVGADAPVPISTVLHDLKQTVGRGGKAALRIIWSRQRSLGTRPLDDWALGSGLKPFWKTRGYDFNVTTEQALHVKLDYIHKNPIARILVDRPEFWHWSSYRYYEYGDEFPIKMDWDGSWPII